MTSQDKVSTQFRPTGDRQTYNVPMLNFLRILGYRVSILTKSADCYSFTELLKHERALGDT